MPKQIYFGFPNIIIRAIIDSYLILRLSSTVCFCQCDGIFAKMGIVLSYTVCKRAIIRCLNCDRRAARPLSVEYTVREVGEPKSLEYRVYFCDKDDNIVSKMCCVKLIVLFLCFIFAIDDIIISTYVNQLLHACN